MKFLKVCRSTVFTRDASWHPDARFRLYDGEIVIAVGVIYPSPDMWNGQEKHSDDERLELYMTPQGFAWSQDTDYLCGAVEFMGFPYLRSIDDD